MELRAFSFFFRIIGHNEDDRQTWPIIFHSARPTFSVQKLPNQWEILWSFTDHSAPPRLRLTLPEFPLERWLHFAVIWEAKSGLLRCYLDGVSLQEDDVYFKPWEDRFQCHEFSFLDSTSIQVRDVVADAYATTLASFPQKNSENYQKAELLLGRKQYGSLKEVELGAAIYKSSLQEKYALENLLFEGPAVAEFSNQGLRIHSKNPSNARTGSCVCWFKNELPDNFQIEWEAKILSANGLCIAFFNAAGRNGEDLFSRKLKSRTGDFSEYHSGDINCYHISYYANTPGTPGRATSNLRKNYGFHLVTNGQPVISSHSREWHRLVLRRMRSTIQMAVDGSVALFWEDDGKTHGHPLQNGKFGLRQMSWTDAVYRNFSLYEIPEDY